MLRKWAKAVAQRNRATREIKQCTQPIPMHNNLQKACVSYQKNRQKHLSAMRISLQWQSAQKYRNGHTTYGNTDVITNKMKENGDALDRGGIDNRWT